MPYHDKTFRTQIMFFLFCVGMVLTAFIGVAVLVLNSQEETLKNREVGKTNQYYNRVVACLASVSPTKRTADYVKFCYSEAERDTGIYSKRYGDGN